MKTKKRAEPLVQLDVVMSLMPGNGSRIITIENDSPELRKELAKHIAALSKNGHIIRLFNGDNVVGYDPETNSWLVGLDKKSAEKVPARSWRAIATQFPDEVFNSQ